MWKRKRKRSPGWDDPPRPKSGVTKKINSNSILAPLTIDCCNGARVRTLLHTASNAPYGIAYDAYHHRLVWCEHTCVRYINLVNGSIHLLAGWRRSTEHKADEVDAIGGDARFGWLSGLAVVPSNGDIIVADNDNASVRRVNALTGEVTTIAGRRPRIRYSKPTYNLTEEEASTCIISTCIIPTFRSPGWVEADFARPSAVAIDSKDNIVVRHGTYNILTRLSINQEYCCFVNQ
jgi:hypothetical protein